MFLDPLTLLVVDILIILLVSVAYYVLWLESRQEAALPWMMTAGLAMAAGLVLRVSMPAVPGIVVSNGIIGAATVCIWMAARCLAERPVQPLILCAPMLIWFGASWVPGFLGSMNARLVLANVIMGSALSLATWEVVRLERETRYLNLCIAGVLACQSIQEFGWALYNLLAPPIRETSFLAIPGIVFINVATLVFALLTAIGMMILIRERSSLHYRRAALIDGLTGLGNRRSLDEILERTLLQTQESGRPLALIMIDADAFKAYNDLYGHVQGDTCLQAIAQVLRGAVSRRGEAVFRYGGEEFVVLLPKLNLAQATAVAERLRLAVRGLNIRHDGQDSGIVTISLGVVAAEPGRDRPGLQAADVLSAADQALYEAKRRGRDLVVSAPAGWDPGSLGIR